MLLRCTDFSKRSNEALCVRRKARNHAGILRYGGKATYRKYLCEAPSRLTKRVLGRGVRTVFTQLPSPRGWITGNYEYEKSGESKI